MKKYLHYSEHLVGIIAIPKKGKKLNFPFHDAFVPVGEKMLAIERAIFECANAGCKTIWIACTDHVEFLLKRRLGHWIKNPFERNSTIISQKYRGIEDIRNIEFFHSNIPIFYCQILPKDENSIDGLPWGILQAALFADEMCHHFSAWAKPERFYVAFPNGLYQYSDFYKFHQQIKSINGFYNFFINDEGEKRSVLTNDYLGFTFGREDLKVMARFVRTRPKIWGSDFTFEKYQKKEVRPLPVEERWQARKLTLKEVFGHVSLDNAYGNMVNSYGTLDDWQSYMDFLSKNKLKATGQIFVGAIKVAPMSTEEEE